MAKDNRTINSAIRVGGKLFKPGQEDEVAALNADQITRLTEKGAISGFDAKADKAAAEPEEATPPKGKAKP
jgi:hypothetical protein